MLTQGMILQIVNMSMFEVVFLSAPILGLTMLLGLVISIFQATTSIQEQTLTFVPKFILVTLFLAFTAPFYSTRMLNFVDNLFSLIATARL